MTTPRDYAPVLDRLIRREVTSMVEVAGLTTFAYDAEYIGGGDHLDNGTWRRQSDTELALGLEDTNGLAFPDDLNLPLAGVEVAFDGARGTALTLTAFEILRVPVTFQPNGILLTFNGPLPAAGTALTIGIDSGVSMTVEQTAIRKTWAQRRDYRGRDFLQARDAGLFSVTSTRFIVRAEGPAWDIGDTFTDDKGATQTVQGVGEIGRGRWLELRTQS